MAVTMTMREGKAMEAIGTMMMTTTTTTTAMRRTSAWRPA